METNMHRVLVFNKADNRDVRVHEAMTYEELATMVLANYDAFGYRSRMDLIEVLKTPGEVIDVQPMNSVYAYMGQMNYVLIVIPRLPLTDRLPMSLGLAPTLSAGYASAGHVAYVANPMAGSRMGSRRRRMRGGVSALETSIRAGVAKMSAGRRKRSHRKSRK
jgi:hypothetical protein